MLKSGFFLFFGLLLGRVLGLAREFLLATSVGAGTKADIIVALVTLPDVCINILIGNSLAAIFIKKIKALSPNQRFGYFLKLTAYVFTAFFLVATVLFFNIESLAKLILPAQASSFVFQNELRWVVWAVPVLSLNAVSRVFLQAENRFSLMGLENVIFNICVIAAILLFISDPSFKIITTFIIIGVLCRWLFQLVQILFILKLNRTGLQIPISVNDFYRYNMALVTGMLMQILPIYSRSMASYFAGDGALAIFNYSHKIIEFPMVLGISVISSVVFPHLAERAERKRRILRFF